MQCSDARQPWSALLATRAPSGSRRDGAVPFQSCIPPVLSFLLNAALLSFVPSCQKTLTNNPDTKPLLPKPGSRRQASSIWCGSLCKTLLPNSFLLVRNFTPQSELSSSFPGPTPWASCSNCYPEYSKLPDPMPQYCFLCFFSCQSHWEKEQAEWFCWVLWTVRRKPTAGRDSVVGLSDLQGLFQPGWFYDSIKPGDSLLASKDSSSPSNTGSQSRISLRAHLQAHIPLPEHSTVSFSISFQTHLPSLLFPFFSSPDCSVQRRAASICKTPRTSTAQCSVNTVNNPNKEENRAFSIKLLMSKNADMALQERKRCLQVLIKPEPNREAYAFLCKSAADALHICWNGSRFPTVCRINVLN